MSKMDWKVEAAEDAGSSPIPKWRIVAIVDGEHLGGVLRFNTRAEAEARLARILSYANKDDFVTGEHRQFRLGDAQRWYAEQVAE